jgi:hypothetical protein
MVISLIRPVNENVHILFEIKPYYRFSRIEVGKVLWNYENVPVLN